MLKSIISGASQNILVEVPVYFFGSVGVNFFGFWFADLVWNWKLALLGLGLQPSFYSHTKCQGIISYINFILKSLDINF